jgi:hypothetical protein
MPNGSRLPFDGLRACCEPLSLAGTAVLGSWSRKQDVLDRAAINGLSHRRLYGAICAPGYPGATDRITLIAAMRTSARS